MKLTVLVDNNLYMGKHYYGEHGFSCYIEDAGQRILFDTGYSDIFMRNASALGIDLGKTTAIVLSHGHNDHTGGLPFLAKRFDLSGMTLVAHPHVFDRRTIDGRDAGCPLTEDELREKCRVRLSREPLRVSENLVFLGGIPQLTEFQPRAALGKRIQGARELDDFILDDSALVYRSFHGLFIITGCAHSGICNVVEYAKQVCSDNRVVGILGGMHLQKTDDNTRAAVKYFADAGVKNLFPCHCCSFKAKALMNETIPVNEVGVGMTIEL